MSANDIPGMLERLAADIRMGRASPVNVVVVLEQPALIVASYGPNGNPHHAARLLDEAADYLRGGTP